VTALARRAPRVFRQLHTLVIHEPLASSWQESSSTVLPQPAPPWATAPAHAALRGSSTVSGRAAWLISFLEPSTPAWFKLAIDKKTMRTLELRMVAPAHFMHHLYSGFNSGFTIKPPAGHR